MISINNELIEDRIIIKINGDKVNIQTISEDWDKVYNRQIELKELKQLLAETEKSDDNQEKTSDIKPIDERKQDEPSHSITEKSHYEQEQQAIKFLEDNGIKTKVSLSNLRLDKSPKHKIYIVTENNTTISYNSFEEFLNFVNDFKKMISEVTKWVMK